MSISETLLQVREYTGIGYAPMIDSGAWRVAILRFVDELLPHRLYNVKRGCWHTHTLNQDATVLIIENQDTNSSNSPETPLGVIQRGQLDELTRQLWEEA